MLGARLGVENHRNGGKGRKNEKPRIWYPKGIGLLVDATELLLQTPWRWENVGINT